MATGGGRERGSDATGSDRSGPGRSVPASVDVVVVTHDSGRFIGDCLDALADEGSAATGVIVVDNQSSDDTVAVVSSHRVGARVVALDENPGYAAAINAGVELSDADAILVLNPDTRIGVGAIDAMRPALNRSGVGLVAPTIVTPAGDLEPSLRRFPTVLRHLGQSVLGARVSGRHPALGDLVVDPHAYEEPGHHDWSSGAAVLVAREVFDTVGPWDESFFLYSEETDFAWRAARAGFSLWFVPEAVVEHTGGESTSSSRLWSMLVTNRVRVVTKHRGRMVGAAFWLVSVVGELVRVGRPRNRAALLALLGGRVDPAVQAARDRRADWLVFAGQDWWYHNRAHSDFQLATRIARSREVLLVNALAMRMPLPGRSPGAWRRIARKVASTTKALRVPVDGLPSYAVLSPVLLPFYGSAFFRRLNAWLVATQVRVALRWRGMSGPVVLTTIPTSVDVLDRLAPRAVAFNRSDKHSAFDETDQPVIQAMEERLLRESDVVFYVSRHLMDEESPLTDGRSRFLDHGVDLRHFVDSRDADSPEPADLAGIPHPRIGFFGGLDDYLVDFALLERLARERPGYHLVLVGDANVDLSELGRLDNVHLLGFKPYETIPGYGSGFDVALMPWLDNEWIASCNPIKLKEYLALGLPVVTTDFPALDPYRHLVSVAGPNRFVEAVDRAVEEAAGDAAPDRRRERRAAVLDASWDRRARQLRNAVENLR